MTTRRNFLQAVGGLALALPAMTVSSRAEGSPQPAVAADRFVDFISVQTHLNWKDTVWDQDAWRPLLGALGVRYTRSALGNRLSRDHLEALHRDFGIRSSVTFNAVADDSSFDLGKTAKTLDILRDRIGAEKLYAIEGPNEYTHKHKTDGWAQRLRDYQEFLHESVKSDAALGSLDVLAPTIWKRIVADYQAIGGLDEFADYGNLHLYNAGRRPSRFNRDEVDEPIDIAIREAQIVVPGKPVCVTETGFNVAVNGPPTRWTVPADVAAKYTLRMLAELFLRRDAVRRVNLYSLIDDGHKDDHFGLLDASLAPRPSYAALKNLIALLADPGPAHDAAPLPFALKAQGQDIRSVLFQKRSGQHLLMLWNDAESYDRRQKAPIAVPPVAATLDLGGTSRMMRSYLPLESADVQGESSTGSMELMVPDHPLIVEIAS